MATVISNRKMLLISYHFPPSAAVGGIRAAKFAKLLPQFGWQPYVLTIEEKHIKFKDNDRLNKVAKVRIIRTALWPTMLDIMLKIKHTIKCKYSTSDSNETIHLINNKSTDSHNNKYIALRLSRLKPLLISLLEFPDKYTGWIVPAVIKGYSIIKNQHIDTIVSTSPPQTSAIIGLILSRITNTPLIIDLRDPLVWDDIRPNNGRRMILDTLEKYLARMIVHYSAIIITTTDSYSQLLKAKYPEIPGEHFRTIWNGYDREDFEALDKVEDKNNSDIFTMSYLGTFYMDRTPKEFLHAIAELVSEGILHKDKIKINFIGNVHYAQGCSVKRLVTMAGLDDCVDLSRPIPFKEAIGIMKRSNILLLFVCKNQFYAIPEKTFQYLAANVHMLCLTYSKAGATPDLIYKTRHGTVVDAADISEIKLAIRKLYSLWKYKKKLVPNVNNIGMFEKQILTDKFARILNESVTV